MSCALAMLLSSRRELEDHALAQPAAADPQRHPEPPGGRVEHQYARRQQLGALRRQAVAARHDGRRRRAERRERALERGAVEHRPDERRQRGGAAADRHGVIEPRHVRRRERRVGRGAHRVDVRARRRIRAAAPRQHARADRERAQPGHAAGHRADRDLGRHAADVDHGDHARGRTARACASRRRTPAGPRRRPTARPTSTPARVAQRGDQLVAVGGRPDRRRGDDAHVRRARRPRPRRAARRRPPRPSAIVASGIVAERVDPRADARERALLEHRDEPPVRRFGDQQPRRVRPDVDAGAAHGRGAEGCHDGRR